MLIFNSAQAAVPKLAPFIKKYDGDPNFKKQPATKVALLDNGVFAMDVKRHQRDLEPADRSLPAKKSIQGTITVDRAGGDAQANKDSGERVMTDQIIRRVSFVEEDGRESPWYFPLDPHGTQMANLICAIDPRCELYVVRIAERRSSITPEIVAKVKFNRNLLLC